MKRSCIDDETIMDYLEGRLNRRLRGRVEKHMSICSDCRDLLMFAADLIHVDEDPIADTVPSAVTHRTIEAVGSMINGKNERRRQFLNSGQSLLAGGRALLDAVAPGPMPQFAGLRSGNKANGDVYIRDCIVHSSFEAVIEIEKITDTHFAIQMTMTTEKPLDSPLRVSLFSGKREIASSSLKDEAVQFEDIPCGPYALIFSKDNQQLKIYDFEI